MFRFVKINNIPLLMRSFCIFLLISTILLSCSNKKHLVYVNDSSQNNLLKINNYNENKIETGDILKIDIYTDIPEASIPYNNINKNFSVSSVDLLVLDGYLVDKNYDINYPILGKINVSGDTESDLAYKITRMLVKDGHLTNPHVKVKKLNSKFTVLGEVKTPGTYPFYDQLNIFQAIGYAGDLLITAKRKDIKLIREENGLRKIYQISLKKSELLDKPYYYLKNNDIIIVEPNFSKIKSAGFIGSPASIASISSLLLSITLLLINN